MFEIRHHVEMGFYLRSHCCGAFVSIKFVDTVQYPLCISFTFPNLSFFSTYVGQLLPGNQITFNYINSNPLTNNKINCCLKYCHVWFIINRIIISVYYKKPGHLTRNIFESAGFSYCTLLRCPTGRRTQNKTVVVVLLLQSWDVFLQYRLWNTVMTLGQFHNLLWWLLQKQRREEEGANVVT